MALLRKYILYTCFCLGLLIHPIFAVNLEAKDFVVVIDAGHGGKDPGAVGNISKEKDINLKVALKLGKLISTKCPGVKVVYTRNRDVFLPLNQRAEIANNAKADLFISVHTNSIAKPKTLRGASTWTLGLARSEANLEVAKRENSVILYESDYQTRYAGFDPNSAESYIIFEFMQDNYMSQSVHLADLIQKHFKNTCKRVDHGVHQAEFLVLRATAMPSVLIELGFISNVEEEKYLNTESGQNTLANGILQAFIQYKQEHDVRLGIASPQPQTIDPLPIPQETPMVNEPPKPAEKPIAIVTSPTTSAPKKTTPATPAPQEKKDQSPKRTEPANIKKDNEIIFKVQIIASSVPIDKNDRKFKGLKNVDHYREGGLYKYTYGASADYNQIQLTRREILPQFKDAFIIAFRNGEKMNINQAIEEFKNKKK